MKGHPKFIKKGNIVFECFNTTEGELKKLAVIEEVYINTVQLQGDRVSSTQISLIKPIREMVEIGDFDPEKECLFMNDRESYLIGYYSSEDRTAEGDGVMLEDVTHFMPLNTFNETPT